MIYTGLCLSDVLHYHDINCFATPYYEMWSYLHTNKMRRKYMISFVCINKLNS